MYFVIAVLSVNKKVIKFIKSNNKNYQLPVIYNFDIGVVLSSILSTDKIVSLIILSNSSNEFNVPKESSIDNEECSSPKNPACNIRIRFSTGVHPSYPGKEISLSFHNNRANNSDSDLLFFVANSIFKFVA